MTMYDMCDIPLRFLLHCILPGGWGFACERERKVFPFVSLQTRSFDLTFTIKFDLHPESLFGLKMRWIFHSVS